MRDLFCFPEMISNFLVSFSQRRYKSKVCDGYAGEVSVCPAEYDSLDDQPWDFYSRNPNIPDEIPYVKSDEDV